MGSGNHLFSKLFVDYIIIIILWTNSHTIFKGIVNVGQEQLKDKNPLFVITPMPPKSTARNCAINCVLNTMHAVLHNFFPSFHTKCIMDTCSTQKAIIRRWMWRSKTSPLPSAVAQVELQLWWHENIIHPLHSHTLMMVSYTMTVKRQSFPCKDSEPSGFWLRLGSRLLLI